MNPARPSIRSHARVDGGATSLEVDRVMGCLFEVVGAFLRPAGSGEGPLRDGYET